MDRQVRFGLVLLWGNGVCWMDLLGHWPGTNGVLPTPVYTSGVAPLVPCVVPLVSLPVPLVPCLLPLVAQAVPLALCVVPTGFWVPLAGSTPSTLCSIPSGVGSTPSTVCGNRSIMGLCSSSAIFHPMRRWSARVSTRNQP